MRINALKHAVMVLGVLALMAPARAEILYSVRASDTLTKIAKANSLSVDAILQANPGLKKSDVLTVGTVLVLPTKDDVATGTEKVQDPLIIANLENAPPDANLIRIDAQPSQLRKIVGPDGRVVELAYEPGVDRSGDRHSLQGSRHGRLVSSVLRSANSFMGTPYSMGGTTSRGIDCSGFTQRVFAMNGVKLPRTADVQFNAGVGVARGQEQPGDLVFFETYLPGPSHVGIYIGDNKFIHASSSRGVTVSSLKETYYRSTYIGARRVLR